MEFCFEIARRAVLSAGFLLAAAAAPWTAASAKPYTLHTLYSIGSESGDGNEVVSRLLRDASGNLYVAAFGGGAHNGGTLEELSPAAHGKWKHKLLYSFCAQSNCADGSHPHTGVIVDTAGNLYGTTEFGGPANLGVAYELIPNARRSKWRLKVLHDFCSKGGADCTDGGFLVSGLTYVGAASGAAYDGTSPLYGTTMNYGTGSAAGGVVYALTPGGTKWKQTVLYNFCLGGCSSGAGPQAGLIADASGNLYGTTSGSGQNGIGGTVFELSPGAGRTHWTETTLHSFCALANCADGYNPYAEVLLDGSGNLFGMTPFGGSGQAARCADIDTSGCGVAFKLVPNGANSQETVLYDFCAAQDCADGAEPDAGFVMDGAGNLFGTTTYGGGNDIDVLGYGGGTVFELNGTRQAIYNFCSQPNCADGEYPEATLIADGSGNLFGTTFYGGTTGIGTVFELTPD
ncbi:MAG TPA: choice-of-anchor tandem repeat GloVer-containing protein [Rhizomicrobium sp.]|nr:choice-of-anchor tandem repeat GloVer-containing protein [Rhizomicrobium sp.]